MRSLAVCPGLGLIAILLSACASGPGMANPYVPPFGSNTIFDNAPQAAPGHQLIVVDLHLEPDSVGVTHYHPWEEYLYVIEGSALLEIPGEEPRSLLPGQSFVIPAQVVHTPKAGPQGVRAVVVRLHRQGDPVMVPVE